MISHIPRSSRIFIGLLIITLLLTYVALTLSMQMNFNGDYMPYIMNVHRNHGRMMNQNTQIPAKILDTTSWNTYQDSAYPLSFLYPKDWKVKGVTNAQKFYDITLDVPKTDSDMHIYISSKGYYGLEGYMHQPYPVGNVKGEATGNNLVGVKAGEYYYTFDGSTNSDISNEFATLLSTVSFK